MSTINQTISLQDKMSSTLKKIYNTASNNIKSFENLHNEVKKVDSSMTKAKSSSSSFLSSLMGFSAIQKVFSMVTGQLDSAITRFDTLNNYQTIMTNLGMSAEDAEKSINTLKQGLDGLPTTLQDSVTSVQRFVSANKNLQASTKMYLALNDAIVAGAASESVQASALEQITQAYTKGKFEAVEWKSMQQAMPAQLDAIAKKLGYTSTAVSGDLYTALQKGSLSMNDFMKAIVELDEEGIDGMANFHDQALSATNGISTAITNMKTAITKGLTDTIGKINEGLEGAGLGSIQQIITNTGKNLQKFIVNIGTGISSILTKISPLINFIKQTGQFVKDNWGVIKTILLGVVTAIGVVKAAQIGWNIVLGISNALESADLFILGVRVAALNMQEGATFAATAAQYGFNAALLACPLTWIIIGIIAIIAVISAVIVAIQKAQGETVSVIGVVVGVIATAGAFIWNTIVGLINAIVSIVDTVANAIISVVEWVLNVCNGGFNSFGDAVANLIGNIISWFLQLGKVVTTIIDAIFGTDWTSGLNSLSSKVESWGKNDNAITLERWDNSLDRISYSDAYNTGYNFGSNLSGGISDAITGDDSVFDSNIDWDSLANTVGTDSTGSSAVKTTTNDDVTISDEDIQLLLDVATRDYKLNYQQVTPNITLTFGDVRETADVDNILDQVADRLEEIYDGNLEVT